MRPTRDEVTRDLFASVQDGIVIVRAVGRNVRIEAPDCQDPTLTAALLHRANQIFRCSYRGRHRA